MTSNGGERGVAVPLALFVLVVLGVLIGSTMWAAHVESRAGRQALQALKARVAAELAWPDVVDRFDSMGVSAMVPGDSLVVGSWIGAGDVTTEAVVHRLGSDFFLIDSEGRAAMSLSPAAQPVFRTQVVARLDSTIDSVTGRATVSLKPLSAPFWSGLPRAH
jgi:hypothetical protein